MLKKSFIFLLIVSAFVFLGCSNSKTAKDKFNSDGLYEEVSWDRVKIQKDEYLGKRVMVNGRFNTLGDNGEIIVLGTMSYSSFDESLTEKILKLKPLQKYTFYGVVGEDDYNRLTLHIEMVE